ncbi:hypothetical protein NPA08_03330 [Mycoplasmopsis citelli]|uniref:hypothetical protein n=1 Tax=Mycoplasmopsis citelli TaxID=171281 RepID=UPI002114EDA0|nr:hypothetical protein [Mycoplasmopsis citelli]UUD35964.1 hypothetical protein NPA08_03330 [Mycoplasmopsis citelli]
MNKKVKLLSLGSLVSLPIVAVISCSTSAETNGQNPISAKISQAKINALPENDKKVVNSLVELLKANNQLINKYAEITSKGPHLLSGKIAKIFNLVDGKDNQSSIVNLFKNKIGLKLQEQGKTKPEALDKINRIFEYVVFNKLGDLTEDLREVFSEYSKAKMEENSQKIEQYILQKSDKKSEITDKDGSLPSQQYLASFLNLLNQQVSNVYFDENYFDSVQKNKTANSILQKDLALIEEDLGQRDKEHGHKNENDEKHKQAQGKEKDNEHSNDENHEHKTDEETHSHSHALANLIYDFYQSAEILVKKVNIDELITQLKERNKILEAQNKIDQEITQLEASLKELKKEFSASIVESANEFFKSTVLETKKIKQLIQKSAQLGKVSLLNTKTKLANE